MVDWRDYITVDPEVCHGRACIAGTRVLVTTVLDNLAAGRTSEEIVRSYPSVTLDSVQAALCYAAELAR
jgi:uncharacterized protein (DUF433 family)